MLLLLLVSCLQFLICDGFNLDVINSVPIRHNKTGSFFGYATAIHQSIQTKNKWIVVGAPQNGKGVVHRCSVQGNTSTCIPIRLTQGVSGKNPWLGATVVSSSGTTVVCAPLAGANANGTCYFGNDELSSISPYLHLDNNKILTKSNAVGFSAAVSKDGNIIYTGSPLGYSGIFVTQIGSAIWPTDRISLENKNLYVTYAMACGKIYLENDGLAWSVGSHVDTQFAGRVYLASSNFNFLGKLIGYQPGEQFGLSLAFEDVNGDGRPDLIVGAPHHSDYDDSQLKDEVGAVYVYFQSTMEEVVRDRILFKRGKSSEQILKGQNARGRFGLAVTGLGDVNLDGFNDIAVGAPYDRMGTVYIFHGSESGLRERPAQAISGDTFDPPLWTFGFSLAGAVDLDGNNYADLVVGAYRSDAVVYVPVRPVLNLTTTINFLGNSSSLSPTDKRCEVACARINCCFRYSNKGSAENVNIVLSLTLDVKQVKAPRLFFIDNGQSELQKTVSLPNSKKMCTQWSVFVRPDLREKAMLIETQMSVKLDEDSSPGSLIQDPMAPSTFTTTLSVNQYCEKKSVCNPDLQLEATVSLQNFTQGSDDPLLVNVSIYNAGENAFGSKFFLYLPATLSFINTSREDSSILCSPPAEGSEASKLHCEIGDPLNTNQTARLRIFLHPVPDVTKADRLITYSMEAFGVNKESEGKEVDNLKNLTLNLQVSTDLVIDGRNGHNTINVTLPESAYTTEKINRTATLIPTFTQFFEIRSKGPSDILGVDVVIRFPSYSAEGYNLSELTDQPKVTGDATCEHVNLTIPDSKDQNDQDQAVSGNKENDQDQTEDRQILPDKENDQKKNDASLKVENQLASSTRNDTVIRCKIGRITRLDRVVIRLSGRLSDEALIKIKNNTYLITSTMQATVTNLPFGVNSSSIKVKEKSVTLTVYKFDEPKTELQQAGPWWVPYVSAAGAIAILAVTTFLLHKLGFFKRNPPPNQQAEDQQLQQQQEKSDDFQNFDEVVPYDRS